MIDIVKKNQNILFLILILLIGFYLRIYNITSTSLWYDELFSLDFSNPKRSFTEMLKLTVEDVHPPFYQTILWLWFKLFGFTELNARFLSVLIGLLTIIASYIFSKEFYSKSISLAVAFIFSTTFFLIWYSQEVRSYQLAVLLAILSYLYLYRTLIFEDYKNLTLYWMITILWMYTHYISFFIIVSQFIFTLLFILFFSKNKKKLFKLLTITSIIFIISLLPLLTYILDISTTDKFYYLEKPSILYFLNYIHTYFGYGGIIFVFFCFLLNLFFLLTTKLSKKEKIFLLMLFTWFFLGYLLLYLKSIYSFSLIQIRYTIVIIPPIILLSIFGISKLKKYLQFIILLIFILFSYKVLFIDAHSSYKQNYKDVLNYVSKYKEIPIYELLPGNGHNGNNTNHFQVYSDILNLNLTIIDDTVFKKRYEKNSLDKCFWIIYTFDNIVISNLDDILTYYKINKKSHLKILHTKKYFRAEASLVSIKDNNKCTIKNIESEKVSK